jgi:hypothetical protein
MKKILWQFKVSLIYNKKQGGDKIPKQNYD